MKTLITQEQIAPIRALAKELWEAKLKLEDALNALEDQGVDLDYEHLSLNNAYTGVDAGITAFHYFVHNYEGIGK